MIIIMLIVIIIISIIIISILYVNEKKLLQRNINYSFNNMDLNLQNNNLKYFNDNNKILIIKNFIQNNDKFLKIILNDNNYKFTFIEYDFNNNIIERTKERLGEWRNKNFILKNKNFKLLFKKTNNDDILIDDINNIKKNFIIEETDDENIINEIFFEDYAKSSYIGFKPFLFHNDTIKFNINDSHFKNKIKITVKDGYYLYCIIYNKFNQIVDYINWSNSLIIEPNNRFIIYLSNNNDDDDEIMNEKNSINIDINTNINVNIDDNEYNNETKFLFINNFIDENNIVKLLDDIINIELI